MTPTEKSIIKEWIEDKYSMPAIGLLGFVIGTVFIITMFSSYEETQNGPSLIGYSKFIGILCFIYFVILLVKSIVKRNKLNFIEKNCTNMTFEEVLEELKLFNKSDN